MTHEATKLVDYAFIFPNKRSGVFFRHYLMELAKGMPIFLPAITTIAEVIGEFSESVEASRLDQLFTLYNEYCRLSPESDDFDRFLYWGEMILSDFNDVNRDLVDHEKLFVNLKRYKEVSANYLTPEQEEILSRYWGAEFVRTSPD
ncbi:MAG: PD-(D/E)XK nuclease family protein, partial [Duncaniella sp.]|nr:PD-(D/E)XK nuclease family protein [Duncaniella sp.]